MQLLNPRKYYNNILYRLEQDFCFPAFYETDIRGSHPNNFTLGVPNQSTAI